MTREPEKFRFSDDQCLQLFGPDKPPFSVLPQESLKERVNGVTSAFLSAHYFQTTSRAPSRVAKQFKGLATRARELKIQISETRELSNSFSDTLHKLARDLADRAEKKSLHNLPSGVKKLLEGKLPPDEYEAVIDEISSYSSNIAARNELKVERRKRDQIPTHSSDKAFQNLIGDLAGLWMDTKGQLPGVSTAHHGDDDISGPFVRFTRSYLDTLKIVLGPEILEQELPLTHILQPTDQALRKRIKNIGIGRLKRSVSP